MPNKPPNVVLVFADQWRAQAFGYAGDPNVQTPNLDALASRSVNCTHAVSGCSVCSPARASLLTGQYPLTHGVFVNDVELSQDATSIAQAFSAGGYDTAYIGKWHVNGRGRASYIPTRAAAGASTTGRCSNAPTPTIIPRTMPATRMSNSYGKATTPWPRPATPKRTYAIAETIPSYWSYRGDLRTPPYHTAPEAYQALYDPAAISLRPNVPRRLGRKRAAVARRVLRPLHGLGRLASPCCSRPCRRKGWNKKRSFCSSRITGDMLGSQGMDKKQKPYEESIRVPFLLRYPGMDAAELDALIDLPDIMPTAVGPVQPTDSFHRGGNRLFRVPTRRPRPLGRHRALAVPPSLWAVVDRRRRPLLPGPTHPPPHVRPRPRGAVAALRQRGRSLPTGQPRRPARPARLARRIRRNPNAPVSPAADDPFLPGPAYLDRWGVPSRCPRHRALY